MKTIKTQSTPYAASVVYKKQDKLNKKIAETYLFIPSIGVFTYAFQKQVFSLREKAMKR